MTQRLREIVEAVSDEYMLSAGARSKHVRSSVGSHEDFAERVARRVADEILALCDEGVAFQLKVDEFDLLRRDYHAGIIRYLRGQIVRRFGLGDGDGE